MNAGTCCAKFFLILVNTIVMIISLAFLAAGIFIKVGGSIIDSFVKQIEENGIPGLTSGVQISDSSTSVPPTGGTILTEWGPYLDTAAIVLIVLGGVLFMLSILGCCGACFTQRCMLITYAVFVGIIFVGELVVVILLFVGTFNPIIKKQLNTTIEEDFISIDSHDPYSLLWNFVHMYFQCCGIDDYRDFQPAKNWRRMREVNGQTIELKTPVSCCKTTGDFPNLKPINESCITTPSDEISNYNNGCVKAVGKAWETYFIIVVAISLALQFLLVCFAVGLVCAANRDEDEEGEESAKHDYNYTYGGHHQHRNQQYNQQQTEMPQHPAGKGQGYYYGQGYQDYNQKGYGSGGGYHGGGYNQQGYHNSGYRY